MAAATSLVEKATSDLLIGPDWGMNLEICDIVNSDPGQAKDVVKAAKKRLGNKSPKVQILTLTVLETLIKNCGDAIHHQVAEKDVLHEMVKIVKKKGDMAVREKILVLLYSWQEAFGGSRGRYPQYYAAYDELRRMGVEFPEPAPENAVPIFTPPQTHPVTASPTLAYGFPAYPPPLEAPNATDVPGLSMSEIENARSGVEVLSEMLNAVDLQDKDGLKAEVIVELVEQCRSTQQRVVNLVNTTTDESLLFQGLALNDDLQRVLAKHDSLSSGSPSLPEKLAGVPTVLTGHYDDEDAEDDFSPLAHRSSSRVRVKSQAGQSNGPGVLKQPQMIPPPPSQMARRLPPPAGHIEKTVDLLSGDSYLNTVNPATATTQPAETSLFTSKESAALPVTPVTFQTSSPINQSLYVSSGQQQQFQPSHVSSENPLPPWAVTNEHLNPQQAALLYGSELPKPSVQQDHQVQSGFKTAPWNVTNSQPPNAQLNPLQTSITSLPPPPVLNTQRQQFFQQQAASSEQQRVSYSSGYESNVRGYNISPYDAGHFSQGYSTGNTQAVHNSRPQVNPKDKLFEDLVDFQSIGAKLKSSGVSGNSSRPSGSKAE
ncbi:hypothetical protein O6H91_18G079800 [Diphasiastrum complanatum]|uniref:Uncharacterized protein n=5 Tax=Diphasiastrum complanatum TaxID=34168 RepID=A0ACC2B2X5_DIPCM|nr:hypothetical protein O6H91_18G079800 [Diphasiastrum complanatum]